MGAESLKGMKQEETKVEDCDEGLMDDIWDIMVKDVNTAKKWILVIILAHDYVGKVGICHETFVARSPQQNSVVERRNRTLIEAARTKLIYARAPLFLWAEVVATACYTQNRSIIRLRHGKTQYELLHDKLLDLSFFHVFGALCYPTNNNENLGKLQSKDDIDLNAFERLEVWEIVPQPDKVMVITLKQIYKVKIDELGEVYISQSDEFVDPDKPNHVYKLKKALYWLKQALRSAYRKALTCGQKDLLVSRNRQSGSMIRSQFTDYGLGFNKILMYCYNKSIIALCCNNVQHSKSKHIDIRYHFIKEHVENGVIELYFVNTEYQLADIFTKALGRELIEFLINKLAMRSFTPETLQKLTDEVDE
nr:integrase, catalytic region, zinc finger, CCHC-type, peptidase aspartic, catalytic [Tanacetum cinerariifolium]